MRIFNVRSALLLLVCGCASISANRQLAVAHAMLRGEARAPERVGIVSEEVNEAAMLRIEQPNLFVAAVDMGIVPAADLGGSGPEGAHGFAGTESLHAAARNLYPAMLSEDKVARSIVSTGVVNQLAAEGRDVPTHWKLVAAKYSRKDIDRFSKLSFQTVGLLPAEPKSPEAGEALLAARSAPDTFSSLAFKYFVALREGKYVDRTGTAFRKPEFTNAMGNDTIVPVFTVLFDAFFDSIMETPVFVKADGKALVGKMPSAAVFNGRLKKRIVDAGEEGVSLAEARAIMYLSGIAASQSKYLTGLIVRLFGDFTLSFGIGANFSFGDNDTLAKVIDQFAESMARHLVEAAATAYFRQVDGDHQVALVKRIIEVYEFFEDEVPQR